MLYSNQNNRCLVFFGFFGHANIHCRFLFFRSFFILRLVVSSKKCLNFLVEWIKWMKNKFKSRSWWKIAFKHTTVNIGDNCNHIPYISLGFFLLCCKMMAKTIATEGNKTKWNEMTMMIAVVVVNNDDNDKCGKRIDDIKRKYLSISSLLSLSLSVQDDKQLIIIRHPWMTWHDE